MKLKIKNLHKIIGKTIPFDTGWKVDMVDESADMYTFLCKKDTVQGWMTAVRLKRDGIKEGKQWKYRFFRVPSATTAYSQVTPDWFENMDNAILALANELETILNK